MPSEGILLNHRRASVYVQGDACYVGGLPAAKEYDRRGHLLRLTQAADGCRFLDVADALFPEEVWLVRCGGVLKM